MNRTRVTTATGVTTLVAGLTVASITAGASAEEAPGPYGTNTTRPAIVSVECAVLDGESAHAQLDHVVIRVLHVDEAPANGTAEAPGDPSIQQLVDLATPLVARACGKFVQSPAAAEHDPVFQRCDWPPIHGPLVCAV